MAAEKVTNFNYLLLGFFAFFGLFILTVILSFIAPGIAKLLFFFLFAMVFLVPAGVILLALLQGGSVDKRPKWGASSASEYFSDLAEVAKVNGWSTSADGKDKLTIKGEAEGLSFEVYATLESDWQGRKARRHAGMTFNFLIKNGPSFYLTQGNLPGLLGEKIISKGEYRLAGVSAIGEDNPKVRQFLLENRPTIEHLFKDKGYLSELHFEDGQMDGVILSDTGEKGDTMIKEIITLSGRLAVSYNKLVAD